MKELSNSPSTPTSRNAPRANSHDGMDHQPLDHNQPTQPVDARPVAVVAAHLGLTDGLVEGCARAEYESWRATVLARFPATPLLRGLPMWDDDFGWRRMRFGRVYRIEAMRGRLEVVWPVIVEHLTTEVR